MDDVDRAILNEIQSDFPIAPRPYAILAQKLGYPEAEIIRRVQRLKDKMIIRRIGANFNSRRLGYTSTLCAAKVPPEKMATFVEVVNSYRGVTHNYRRHHEYNVWFTLIAPSQAELEQLVAEISRKTEVQDILNLPAERIFKIHVDFEV
ncbi:MAG: AsnC family transcriptional regulator [Deltaproteobacteria bacterium]|nr:AsnC family transcriptional regulator [Deltaproteobacteria bacterium]MBW2071595.1 AsnC family transcriptional regulator [Deltaproteobacteria bacterium]